MTVEEARLVSAVLSDLPLPRKLRDEFGPAGRSVTVLRCRADAVVFRMESVAGKSAIGKFWNRPGLKGSLRRWSRTSAAFREQSTLTRLSAGGASVPQPLGNVHCAGVAGFPYTEGLFLSDVGPCQPALDYLKELVAAGVEHPVHSFEEQIIDLTELIIRAGIVDTDHSLANIVVPANGRAVRLDFELARWVGDARLFPTLAGRMLGRLLASYVYACQPDVSRVRPFAQRLQERLRPSRKVMAAARKRVERGLASQREKLGIHTTVEFGW